MDFTFCFHLFTKNPEKKMQINIWSNLWWYNYGTKRPRSGEHPLWKSVQLTGSSNFLLVNIHLSKSYQIIDTFLKNPCFKKWMLYNYDETKHFKQMVMKDYFKYSASKIQTCNV